MEIIKTMPGDNRFYLFEDLPKRLYPAESIRNTQPDNYNIAFLHACYVLLDGGEPKARAALYQNLVY